MKSLFIATAIFCSAPLFAEVVTDITAQEVSDATAAKAFIGQGAVHSNDYRFQCDYFDQQRAINLASDTAMFSCYEQGFNSCVVKQASITQTGYLGYNPDFGKALGYGCLAKALVRGE